MDESTFRDYLQGEGRSASAIERCVRHATEFTAWLDNESATLDRSQLLAYVARVEESGSAKGHLWALRYYFRFLGADDLATLAGELRRSRVKQTPYALSEFSGVDPALIGALRAGGVRNCDQLLATTAAERARVTTRLGVDAEALEDLCELARFATIRGVKDVRARLYRGAVGTLEDLAALEPDELIASAADYIAATEFDGIPPTPKEAAFTVAEARRLIRS